MHKNAIKISGSKIYPPHVSFSIDCQAIDFSMILVDFCIDRSRFDLLVFQRYEAFVGVALLGVALARSAR